MRDRKLIKERIEIVDRTLEKLYVELNDSGIEDIKRADIIVGMIKNLEELRNKLVNQM